MALPRSITVDIEAISAVKHSCSCCTSALRCCCAFYDVCATKREMNIILGVMPVAAEFCSSLKVPGGFSNVFEETDDGLYSIDTDENGLCVFACRAGKKVRCSLHSAALRLGILPASIKPRACTLWPLMLSGGPDARLSISNDALEFGCCEADNGKGERSISEAFLASIGDLWGASARKRLAVAAKRGSRRAKLLVSKPVTRELSFGRRRISNTEYRAAEL